MQRNHVPILNSGGEETSVALSIANALEYPTTGQKGVELKMGVGLEIDGLCIAGKGYFCHNPQLGWGKKELEWYDKGVSLYPVQKDWGQWIWNMPLISFFFGGGGVVPISIPTPIQEGPYSQN